MRLSRSWHRAFLRSQPTVLGNFYTLEEQLRPFLEVAFDRLQQHSATTS